MLNRDFQTPALGQARLLPRFRALAQRDEEQAKILRRAIGDAVADDRPSVVPQRVTKAEPGELRGIPALARGVGGVEPGTHPEQETLRRMGRAA